MILKEAKFKKVKRMVMEQISPAQYGCDCCKNVIKPDQHKLDIDVFCNDPKLLINENREGLADKYTFCSWKCVFKYLPKIKCDYFISLPYLHFEKEYNGIAIKDFMKFIKKIQ